MVRIYLTDHAIGRYARKWRDRLALVLFLGLGVCVCWGVHVNTSKALIKLVKGGSRAVLATCLYPVMAIKHIVVIYSDTNPYRIRDHTQDIIECQIRWANIRSGITAATSLMKLPGKITALTVAVI